MQIKLTLNSDFNIDTSIDATVTATSNDQTVMRVIVQFDADNTGRHRILTDADYGDGLAHYTQAKIIYDACLLIDSHFDGDGEPMTEATISA